MTPSLLKVVAIGAGLVVLGKFLLTPRQQVVAFVLLCVFFFLRAGAE